MQYGYSYSLCQSDTCLAYLTQTEALSSALLTKTISYLLAKGAHRVSHTFCNTHDGNAVDM